MMKQLLTILIVIGAFLLVKDLLLRYQSIKKQEGTTESAAHPAPAPAATSLTGLPPHLEGPLEQAEKLGAQGLKNFLNAYRFSIRDPRLADIELDYVILVSRHDPVEAKRVFNAVKDRTPTSSPIYHRIKSLEKTYQ